MKTANEFSLSRKLAYFDEYMGPHLPYILEEKKRNPDGQQLISILEIGCGRDAAFAFALQEKGFLVTAIDPFISDEAMKKADEINLKYKKQGEEAESSSEENDEEFKRIALIKEDFVLWNYDNHLDSKHTHFDVVLFTKSLHHIFDLSKAVLIAWALVQPCYGHMIIEEFAREDMNDVTATIFYGLLDSYRNLGYNKHTIKPFMQPEWMQSQRALQQKLERVNSQVAVLAVYEQQQECEQQEDEHKHHNHHNHSHHHHHHQTNSISQRHKHHHPDHISHYNSSSTALPPLERWRRNHLHDPPLHTGAEIRKKLAELFLDVGGGVVKEYRVPHLYNYFADMFEDLQETANTVDGYHMIEHLYNLEKSLIEKKAILAVGVNFVVEKHSRF